MYCAIADAVISRLERCVEIQYAKILHAVIYFLYRPNNPKARTPSAPTPAPIPSLIPNSPFPTSDLGQAVCEGHAELVGFEHGVHVEDAEPNKSCVEVCGKLEVVVVIGPNEISVVLKQFVAFKGVTAEGRTNMMSTH